MALRSAHRREKALPSEVHNDTGELQSRKFHSLITRLHRDPTESRLSKALLRGSLVAGVIAAPMGFAATIDVIESTKGFEITKQTVSSLLTGQYGTRLTDFLVAGSLLAAASSYAYFKSLKETTLGKIGVISLGASTLALAAAAILHPPDPEHYPLASTYFVTAAASLGAIGYGLIKKGIGKAGALTLAAAVASTASGLAGFAQDVHVPALYELMASSATGIWMSITSGFLLYKSILHKNSKSTTGSN